MTTSGAILESFYRANGQFVPVAQCPAAAVTELRQLGYEIETHPFHGHRLVAAPDRLSGDDLRARLGATTIGAEIIVFEETASTNDVAGHLAAAGAREGLVVFAESQTRGRGRHGRAWTSPRGKGLWFSVILWPRLPPAALPRITVAASVAVHRAVRQLAGCEPRIKWPNDLTLNDRKLAGILTERHAGAAILGIGLNVNCQREDFPADLPATSLRIETGKPLDRAALAAAILAALDEYYRRAHDDFESVVTEWAQWCTTLGRQVVVKMGPRRIEGCAQALDGDGALLLRRDNGQTERILGADMMVERA